MGARREFLETLLSGTTLAILLPSRLAARPPSGRKARPESSALSDVALLNASLELEHAAIHAYTLLGGRGLLSLKMMEVGPVFKGSHERHRDALAGLIRELGGRPVPAQPRYDFGAFNLQSERDVLLLALFLELKAARAFQSALPQLRSPLLHGPAGRMLGDEVSHAVVLRGALGKPAVGFYGQLDEGLD